MAKASTELIHCDNCGEDYAATYRRCPFCNAKPGTRSAGEAPAPLYEDTYYDEEPAPRRGGKRLAGGKTPRQGGGDGGQILRTVLYLLSALIIVAAVWIVGTKLLPKLIPASQPSPSVEPSVQPSVQPTPSAEPSPSWEPLPSLDPAVTDDPLGLDSPDLPSVEPDPLVSQAPVVTATPAPSAAGGSLTLSSTDFTMSPRYPTYQMEITGVGRSQATYSIKNESVATVSSTGLITAVGNGTTTLTVTDKNSGASATCTVRVSGMSGQASATPAPSQSSGSSGATLSTTDFTLSKALGYSAKLTVRGGTAASWSSSNESVATVSSDGTVTGHDKGTARITCTLDTGDTLRAIVRVN